MTNKGGFHTDLPEVLEAVSRAIFAALRFTQDAGSSRSNLRHPGKATAARMPMKTQNDAMTTETPPPPHTTPPSQRGGGVVAFQGW